jgi:hypothetical protein
MNNYKNSRKDAFLATIPQASIETHTDCLTEKCKFNFAYFTKQPASQSFEEWNHDQLCKLLNKIKEYSNQPLTYWKNERLGKSGSVLSIYGAFPKSSACTYPSLVPHQAQWATFRLESAVRLAGFILPQSYNGHVHPATGMRYDCNTFYVVFLDANHKFYITKKK